MDTVTRQSIGIDIAKSTFTACICERDSDSNDCFSEVVTFDNTKTGFNRLVKWSRKTLSKGSKPLYLMEATGVYYEPLAYHLARLGFQVSIVLPNKITHYAKSFNTKSKTDAIDARIIANLGVSRKLRLWEPPAPVFKQLRELTRYKASLKHELVTHGNRLDQLQASEQANKFVLTSLKQIIAKLKEEAEKADTQIEQLLKSDEHLWAKVEKLLTIKGLGLKTIAVIIAETQGFKLINNQRQLASYAGYDVVRRESGTSINHKTRISKKGNSHIRASLYFPAMVASRYNPKLKTFYDRLCQKKKPKMIAMVALQRKLLILTYTLWKKDQEYMTEVETTECKIQVPSIL